MKYAIYKTSKPAFEKAGAAVSPYRRSHGGFTMMELMVVIIIIGILATLAYSNLMDLIFTSRAKETAQTMRAFAERALSEGKRTNKTVTIKINDNNQMEYKLNESGSSPSVIEPLNNSYSQKDIKPTDDCETSSNIVSFNGGAVSQLKIGISGIALEGDQTKTEGYFAACDAQNYCSAAVKVNGKNSFVACIKRPKNDNWEAL